jgi:ribosomal protein S3AE
MFLIFSEKRRFSMNFKDIMGNAHSHLINRKSNEQKLKDKMRKLLEGELTSEKTQELMQEIVKDGYAMGFDLMQINYLYAQAQRGE